MGNNEFLTATLEYASAGFRVFPLQDGGKAPRTKHGCKEATTDTEQIRSWWTAYPNANIGLACGAVSGALCGNLTVIDLDSKPDKDVNGFKELYEWQQENGALPETLTVNTGGGGYHLYFFSDRAYKNGTDILGNGSGGDVRDEGGYVVAPPSIHQSGRRYEWVDGFDVSRIADGGEILDKLLSYQKAEAARKAEAAPRTAAAPAKVQPELVPFDRTGSIIQRLGLTFTEGSRNTDLFKLAASLQAQGYSDEAIREIVSQANAERCSAPLGDKELETTLESVLERYNKGIPRTLEAAGGDLQIYSERLAEKFPYIIPHEKKDSIYYTVSTQLLAAYVREHDRYFFLATGGEKPLAFWYEGGCYKRVDDNTFKGYIKRHIERFDEQLVITRDLDEVYRLLLTDGKRVRSDELNSAESLICFKNGILNIDTLELVPHSPDLYITIQIPCDWTYKRGCTGLPGENIPECSRFNQFLDTLTSGNRDMQRLLWEYIGFIISNIPGYRPKKALFLYGPGDTGKSQLLELIKRLIGSENYASTDIRELEERFATSTLWNKRLAGSPDMSAMKVDELKIFKKLTGGDDIPFEFKGKDKFTDKYRGALMMCANELPKFGGDKGDHVYGRMMLCPCTNVIPPEKRDRQLIDKLYAEREGIVYNAVLALGFLRVNGMNFIEPDVCCSEIAKYKTENDNVLQFLDECTERREVLEQQGCERKTSASDIYKFYRNWASANGCFTQSNQEFRKSLCRRYGVSTPQQLERKDRRGNRFYVPFDLTDISVQKLQGWIGGQNA